MKIQEWEEKFCKMYTKKTGEEVEVGEGYFHTHIFPDGSFIQFAVDEGRLWIGRTFGIRDMKKMMKFAWVQAWLNNCPYILTTCPRGAKAYARLSGATSLGETEIFGKKEELFIISITDLAKGAGIDGWFVENKFEN